MLPVGPVLGGRGSQKKKTQPEEENYKGRKMKMYHAKKLSDDPARPCSSQRIGPQKEKKKGGGGMDPITSEFIKQPREHGNLVGKEFQRGGGGSRRVPLASRFHLGKNILS